MREISEIRKASKAARKQLCLGLLLLAGLASNLSTVVASATEGPEVARLGDATERSGTQVKDAVREAKGEVLVEDEGTSENDVTNSIEVPVGEVFSDLDVNSLNNKYKEIQTLEAIQQNKTVHAQEAMFTENTIVTNSAILKAFVDTDNDYYNKYKEHCENLDINTATEDNLMGAYARAGYLYETEKIDAYTFRQILNMLEYSYSQFGVYVSKDSYLESYMNAYYMHSMDRGVYQDYISTILGYGSLGNPYHYDATTSGEVLLATAYAVASSWARGESTAEPLRYSQSQSPMYTSPITGEQFEVRPDCTGFCYTVLRELGVQVDLIDSGIFWSGSLVDACDAGALDADPLVEVIPFSVDELQPGDIMVTSWDKTVKVWNGDAIYGSHGHAEIFVGFPDENNRNIIDVWNWGGHDVVNKNWPVNQDVYTPERKTPSYNYSYIIRYVGGGI